MTKRVLALAVLALLPALRLHASDFRRYSWLVNQAELQWMEERYDSALHYYDAAFALKPLPFALDLYNASICAVKAGHKDLAMRLCHRLADKGTGREFFSATNAYQPLFQRKDWKAHLQHALTTRVRLLAQSRAVRNKIDSLIAKDQYYNHAWRNSGMAKQEEERMNLANDTISRALKQLCTNYGFPGEDRLGAYLTDQNRLSYDLPFEVIIIHNYQNRRTGDTVFSGLLKAALEQGDISPQQYAALLDKGSNMGQRPYYGEIRFYIQYKCRLYLDKYNEERRARIDSNRAAIGLCTTADLLKKVIYRTRYPASDFRISAYLSVTGSFSDPESEALVMKERMAVSDDIPGCTE